MADDVRNRYEHFAVFGQTQQAELAQADEMYDTVPSVLGFQPEFNKHPVVVLPGDVYNRSLNRWSQAQYEVGGVIYIRSSSFEGDTSPTDTVLHEVVHAYNEKALSWSVTGVKWFDEGTAKYVEFIVNQKRDVRQPEIFGDPVRWKAPCGEEHGGGRCVFTLAPRQTPDDLWRYYQNDYDFMKTWRPGTSPNKAFGYAFSELLVRNYVRKNGIGSLHPVYDSLRKIDTQVRSAEEAS
ncbi:MAG: hypothetical protein SXQ77_02400, partial [Halobacteria archaeon]|nr:hypothetical protein [Halobacteria archaeon]